MQRSSPVGYLLKACSPLKRGLIAPFSKGYMICRWEQISLRKGLSRLVLCYEVIMLDTHRDLLVKETTQGVHHASPDVGQEQHRGTVIKHCKE